jgi:hypothetical protein
VGRSTASRAKKAQLALTIGVVYNRQCQMQFNSCNPEQTDGSGGGINDSTFARRSSFRCGNSLKPNSAFPAIQLSMGTQKIAIRELLWPLIS